MTAVLLLCGSLNYDKIPKNQRVIAWIIIVQYEVQYNVMWILHACYDMREMMGDFATSGTD